MALDEDIEEEEDDANEQRIELAIPKKLMVLHKNVIVDLIPAKDRLESLVKDWNAWRKRPRSVSQTQDAEAVAAALGPPLESMSNYLQEACSAVATAAACGADGADLTAFACREALQGARTLAAKLLGEEPTEPPPPPSLNEPPPAIVPVAAPKDLTPEEAALKLAAEVAQAGIGPVKTADKRDKSRKRSRSRKRRKKRRKESSSSSS